MITNYQSCELSQSSYLKKMVERFKLLCVKTAHATLNHYTKLRVMLYPKTKKKECDGEYFLYKWSYKHRV